MHGHPTSAWEQFVQILTKPDNIPIVGMFLLVFFFTWVALRQGFRNDRLLAEGRENEIADEAQR